MDISVMFMFTKLEGRKQNITEKYVQILDHTIWNPVPSPKILTIAEFIFSVSHHIL